MTPEPQAATEPLTGWCWFCHREVPIDSLIAGYDTFEEQRLACNTCNDAIQWLNHHGLVVTRTPAPVASGALDVELATFVSQSGEAMAERMAHGAAKFGTRSWREDAYEDEDNLERLRRAVDHLEAARRNSPDEAEWRKRAADVANQAFMFADPERLRAAAHPDTAGEPGETRKDGCHCADAILATTGHDWRCPYFPAATDPPGPLPDGG